MNSTLFEKHLECARVCQTVYNERSSDVLVRPNPRTKEVIVAVEGSDTLVNWFDNFCVFKRNDVHTGFRKYATYCKRKYKLHNTLSRYKDHKMYLCGHSLGAAATALIAHDFSDEFDIELVLFGCPNIGGHEFRSRFESSDVLVFGYVLEHDIVSKLPFELMGYTPLIPNPVRLESPYDPVELIRNHSMHTYIAELERLDSITRLTSSKKKTPWRERF